MAEARKNVSFVKSEDVLSCDFGQELSFYPLCEVVYPYDEVFVLVGSHHEGFEDI